MDHANFETFQAIQVLIVIINEMDVNFLLPCNLRLKHYYISCLHWTMHAWKGVSTTLVR